ncbi:MAG: hypothetical protein K0V04_19835, partial [Deltaproteobacteria bacterium]|nr:hypothetical protein [Deltaproteobacteria bacterium]
GEGGEGDDAGVDQGVRAAADGSDATKADADPVRAEPFEAAASVATGGPDRSGSTTVASLAEHRRRRTTWGVAAFGMVAAALLAVWIIPSGPLPVHDADAMADAQLPRFELVARNDTVQTVRKGPEATDALPRYRADTRVQWIIRPARKVSSTLALRLLATPIRPTTGERQLIDPGPIVVSEEGVIELRGVFGETVGLSPGRWSVEAVVGGVVPVDIAMYDAGGSWVTAPAHPLEVIP